MRAMAGADPSLTVSATANTAAGRPSSAASMAVLPAACNCVTVAAISLMSIFSCSNRRTLPTRIALPWTLARTPIPANASKRSGETSRIPSASAALTMA